jgi:importin subunit alpha-6/7
MLSRSKQEQRRRNFKKGIDASDCRRRREETTLAIRKTKREESLQKRRNLDAMVGEPESASRADERLARLPELVQTIMGNNEEAVVEAVRALRKLLSIEKNPPIADVIATGVVPRLAQFLRCESNTTLQFESAWALTNIASGTSEQTHVVIDHECVPLFVCLLRSPSEDVREQAIWALGNIAGDSAKCRDLVLKAGAMDSVVHCLANTENLSMLRNGTWTLSNLCRGKPGPQFEAVRGCIPLLANLLRHSDTEVLTDTCWAFSYLTDGENSKIQAVLEAGVARRVCDLLQHSSTSVQTPALRIAGNIVTGTDVQTQAMLNAGFLDKLLYLLKSTSRANLLKEGSWAVSNITAGNQAQLQVVLDSGIMSVLLKLLRDGSFDVKKECTWAVSNATSTGSSYQISVLVKQGCLPPLCTMLDCNDSRTVHVALEGTQNILKVGAKMADKQGTHNRYAAIVENAGGVDTIEELQNHDNEDIYNKAIAIIEEYFDGEENDEEDSNIPNSATTTTKTLGMPAPAFSFSAGPTAATQQYIF